MHIDPWITVAGAFVGFTVGLTGMGGGALMTPILVLIFKVNPLTAVSSDVVASLVMKPVAGGVHLRRGTVNLHLVRWLCIGSVPAAFCGVLILRSLGHGPSLQHRVQLLLGAALLIAAVSIFLKGLLALRNPDRALARDAKDVKVKIIPTLIIGVVGGLIVGMTSVGSGSLIIVLLLFLYPRLTANQLVGTDLVQAVPLVAAAALGHLIFGDFQLSLTAGLLLGAVPGAYVGARVSASAPDQVIRPALMFVLTASALKLLGLSAVGLAWALAATVSVAAGVTYGATMRQRRRAGAAAETT